MLDSRQQNVNVSEVTIVLHKALREFCKECSLSLFLIKVFVPEFFIILAGRKRSIGLR